MTDDGSGPSAALGGLMAARASGKGQSSAHGLATNVDGANTKADKLGERQKTLCPTCPCEAETLKANVLRCSGSKNVWDKARAAAKRDPRITVEPVRSGADGESDSSGKVKINPKPNCCAATQTTVFELTNVASSPRFDELNAKAAAGKIGREDFARGNERIEYDGVYSSADTFNSCRKAWGCDDKAQASYGYVKDFKTFDDYFNYVDATSNHTDGYRSDWDQRYSK